MKACAAFAYAGDGYCDDGNNVAGCDWDGGGGSANKPTAAP